MNYNDMYLMKNFDFLVWSFVRMYVQGQLVDFQVIVGNMDEEYCEWFCQCYELYCCQVSSQVEVVY